MTGSTSLQSNYSGLHDCDIIQGLTGCAIAIDMVVMAITAQSGVGLAVWIQQDDVVGVQQAGNEPQKTKKDVDPKVRRKETSFDKHRNRRDEEPNEHQEPVSRVHDCVSRGREKWDEFVPHEWRGDPQIRRG